MKRYKRKFEETNPPIYTSKMNIEDYSGKQEEGCKKKPKKKRLEESIIITTPLQASYYITKSIEYLTGEYNLIDPKIIKLVSNGIYDGILGDIEGEINPHFDNKYIFQFLTLVFKNIKNRVK